MNQKYQGQEVHDEKIPIERPHDENRSSTSLPTSGKDLKKTSITLNSSAIPPIEPDADSPPPGNGPPEEVTYPEGGLRAYSVVFGSFCGMVAAFGLMNTVGTFQAYLSTHQLAHYSPSSIGWIFSLYVFLAFFCGIQIGPVFDAKGPRWLVVAGTVCLVVGAIGVAESTGMSNRSVAPPECSTCFTPTVKPPIPSRHPTNHPTPVEYWHFILTFSLLGGTGTSLIFTPAVSAISHFFLASRAAATGLATTGGSIGGIIFPLMLQQLFPLIGYKWAVRCMALIFLVLLLLAILLIRSRLPPKKGGNVWPDFRIFGNTTFALTTAGVFFVEWGLFIPLSYISSYALANGISPTLSYQLLAVVNAGSFFGRWAPGYLADRLGRFNTMIATVFLCLLSALAIWLTAGSSIPQICVFGVLFGFASGSNISLTPVCVGQLCETEEFGRWYATCYTVVSFGCLTGIPIAGQIIATDGGRYWGLIVFTGACYAGGLGCFVAARVLRAGWSLNKIY